jgi:hypothetical protein
VKTLFGKATKGVPSVIGVLWGIFLYVPGVDWAWYLVTVMVVALFLLWVGRKCLVRYPLIGWILIEFWVLSAISVVALSTAGILWLTVNAPSFFPIREAEQKAVAGALVGAVTAFLAVLWTKDVEEATGPFWPSTQFKKGLSSAFSSAPGAPAGDTRAWDAVYEERVREQGPAGWGFIARYERALILRKHLQQLGKGE